MEILVELMDNIMIADNAVVRVDLPGMAGPVEKRMLLYNVQNNVLCFKPARNGRFVVVISKGLSTTLD